MLVQRSLRLSHAISRARAARVMQKIAHNSSSLNIAYTYDCRRILKHVLKTYDIFFVTYKIVVGELQV